MTHRQPVEVFHDLDPIAEFLGIEFPEGMYRAEQAYPVLANSYYLSLIDRNDPFNDPLLKQCLPHSDELLDYDASFDPLAEERQSVVPRLIHRYYDRAVMIATNRCASYCRFCFRKRFWKRGNQPSDVSDAELEEICTYYRAHPELKEILVSGGDPLMLPERRLKYILDRLAEIDSLEVIRLASRIPVFMPQRISDELVNMLSAYPCLWFATHFNHPRELTDASREACRKLIAAGIPVINQTVLLKGVNDAPETLEELFRQLIRTKVKPHYLFHIDPVTGVRHFATGIEKGKEILRYCRPRLSSLATPAFAIDLPEGGGKVSIQENYYDGECYETIFSGKVKYPEQL